MAPTLAKNNVALVGDASHGTLPYCGCGGGNIFEDVLCLTRLLKKMQTSKDMLHLSKQEKIVNALQKYSQMRYDHLQTIIDNTRQFGLSYDNTSFKMNKFIIKRLPIALFNNDVNVRLDLFVQEENVEPLPVSWTKPICYCAFCCFACCAAIAGIVMVILFLV